MHEAQAYGIVKMEVVILDKIQGHKTYTIIQDYLQNQAQNDQIHGYIDFVAVGNGGLKYDKSHGQSMLGSVANNILRQKNMNVLFCP